MSNYFCINSTRHATHQNSVPGRVFCLDLSGFQYLTGLFAFSCKR